MVSVCVLHALQLSAIPSLVPRLPSKYYVLCSPIYHTTKQQCYFYMHMRYYICSAQFVNLRNFEIVPRKLEISNLHNYL